MEKMTGTISEPNKADDLRSKPDVYLDCRDLRHAWNRIGFFHFSGTRGQGTCRKAVCARCGTCRHSYYDDDGSLLFTEYDYPDHYLLVGSGRVSTSDVRSEAMRRHRVYATEESLSRAIRRNPKKSDSRVVTAGHSG
jgi:hypothetical protein